ncbi:MAG: Serine protease, partial [Patescibacteria group bacterium]|nr:Serine protease [Patescibacteria group bacterium]
MINKKVGKATDSDIANAAAKTHLDNAGVNNKTNHHKLKPHHAKPYRKRHYGSLIILVSFLFISSLLLLDFSVIINHNTNNAKNYLSNNFATPALTEQTISSSYGYKLQYNPNKYYAAGITSTDNKLYVGTDLSNTKDYKTIVISSSPINRNSNAGSITINYLNDNAQTNNANLQKDLVDSESSPNSELVLTNSSDVEINNVTFLKTNWQRQYNGDNSIPQLSALVTTYSGNVNGSPMTIVINHGLTKENTDYIKIIENLNFDNNVPLQKSSSTQVDSKPLSSKSVLDNILFSGIASAAESSTVPSEKIASMYSPAVVRIYNLYCQNAKIDNVQYLKTVCNGGVGSGFLISSNGYIATNGHVASSSIKEMLIAYAIEGIYLGDDTIINKLYSIAGGTDNDLMGKTQQEAAGIVFDKIYQIPDNRFSSDTSTHNMLVTLGENQPNVEELKNLTAKNEEFTETENIKLAKPVAIDYRAYDGINGFKASDVALI